MKITYIIIIIVIILLSTKSDKENFSYCGRKKEWIWCNACVQAYCGKGNATKSGLFKFCKNRFTDAAGNYSCSKCGWLSYDDEYFKRAMRKCGIIEKKIIQPCLSNKACTTKCEKKGNQEYKSCDLTTYNSCDKKYIKNNRSMEPCIRSDCYKCVKDECGRKGFTVKSIELNCNNECKHIWDDSKLLKMCKLGQLYGNLCRKKNCKGWLSKNHVCGKTGKYDCTFRNKKRLTELPSVTKEKNCKECIFNAGMKDLPLQKCLNKSCNDIIKTDEEKELAQNLYDKSLNFGRTTKSLLKLCINEDNEYCPEDNKKIIKECKKCWIKNKDCDIQPDLKSDIFFNEDENENKNCDEIFNLVDDEDDDDDYDENRRNRSITINFGD